MGDEKEPAMQTSSRPWAARFTFGERPSPGGMTTIESIDNVPLRVSGLVIDAQPQVGDDGDMVILIDRGHEWATGLIYGRNLREAAAHGLTISSWDFGTYHRTLNGACGAFAQRVAGRSASEVR